MDQAYINHLVFLSKHGGPSKRATIASFKNCPKSILKKLATDKSRAVRLAVVLNQASDKEVLSEVQSVCDSVVGPLAMIRLGLCDHSKLTEFSKSSSKILSDQAKQALGA